jgi:uncharacterized protein YfaQ (DUF2300 family)
MDEKKDSGGSAAPIAAASTATPAVVVSIAQERIEALRKRLQFVTNIKDPSNIMFDCMCHGGCQGWSMDAARLWNTFSILISTTTKLDKESYAKRLDGALSYYETRGYLEEHMPFAGRMTKVSTD